MDPATNRPPATFDLEQPIPAGVPIQRRPGHAVRVGPPFAFCECGIRTKQADPARLEQWVYAHLGIAYDTAINEAVHA